MLNFLTYIIPKLGGQFSYWKVGKSELNLIGELFGHTFELEIQTKDFNKRVENAYEYFTLVREKGNDAAESAKNYLEEKFSLEELSSKDLVKLRGLASRYIVLGK